MQECETVVITFSMPAIRRNSYDYGDVIKFDY